MKPDYLEISSSAASSLKQWLAGQHPGRVAVLCDENTALHCLPKITTALPENVHIIQIQAGETYKTLESCAYIWEELTRQAFDRNGLLINLGGGVIGDMGGFCASTYKRGMRFLNLPTTLLAAVDASIGGKLGIDFQGFKNHIGLFRTPERVIIDADFLNSLPEEEMRSGYAEVVKHALIADAKHWDYLRQLPWYKHNWQRLIAHSVKIKQQIVSQDPEEKGLRKALNFGHTLGHAIESYLLPDPNRRLLHGEAIALGMQCAAWLSHRLCGLAEADMQKICRYIESIWPQPEFTEAELEAIALLSLQDKKNTASQRQFSLLPAIGKVEVNVPVTEKLVMEALHWQQKKGWH